MKPKLSALLSTAVLAAGTLMAQTPAAPQTDSTAQARHARGLNRMGTILGLSDSQKAQAQLIFDAERQAAQPLLAQMRTLRQALHTAATGGAGDVDALSAQMGTLTGQLTAIHTKSMAQFHAILTPDQQTKADAMRGPGGFGFMRGGPHQQ